MHILVILAGRGSTAWTQEVEQRMEQLPNPVPWMVSWNPSMEPGFTSRSTTPAQIRLERICINPKGVTQDSLT
ncbi:MAG: hypothetical protein WAW61_14040 [Methylococcaceae bacterium]